MTKSLFVGPALLLALAFFAGCMSEPARSAPQDSTKYTLENTDNFEVLGQNAQTAVAGTGLQSRQLPDGRLEIVANVKNRADHPVKIQLNCAFKDDQNFTTGDETPLQSLTLAPHATEAVRFTAPNPLAKKYTIRVRELH